jgi:hypothetical protein
MDYFKFINESTYTKESFIDWIALRQIKMEVLEYSSESSIETIEKLNFENLHTLHFGFEANHLIDLINKCHNLTNLSAILHKILMTLS